MSKVETREDLIRVMSGYLNVPVMLVSETLNALEADGLVVVPKEATGMQIMAGMFANSAGEMTVGAGELTYKEVSALTKGEAISVYTTMLSATPFSGERT